MSRLNACFCSAMCLLAPYFFLFVENCYFDFSHETIIKLKTIWQKDGVKSRKLHFGAHPSPLPPALPPTKIGFLTFFLIRRMGRKRGKNNIFFLFRIFNFIGFFHFFLLLLFFYHVLWSPCWIAKKKLTCFLFFEIPRSFFLLLSLSDLKKNSKPVKVLNSRQGMIYLHPPPPSIISYNNGVDCNAVNDRIIV